MKACPPEWLNSPVPVYFDFATGNEPDDPFPIEAPVVWCLLPKRALENAIIVAVAKDSFIGVCRTGAEALFDDGELAVTTYIRRQRCADHQPLATFEAYMARRSRLKRRF